MKKALLLLLVLLNLFSGGIEGKGEEYGAYALGLKNFKVLYYAFLMEKIIPRIEKDIETILANDWDDAVDRWGLMHVHILRSINDRSVEDFFNEDKVILLYHTREFHNKIDERKDKPRYSVVSKLNGEITAYKIFDCPYEYALGSYEYVGTFLFDDGLDLYDPNNEFSSWSKVDWGYIDLVLRTDKYVFVFYFEGDYD